MRNLIYFFIVICILCSCDRQLNWDFIIENKYTKPIDIIFVTYDHKSIIHKIFPYEIDTIYKETEIRNKIFDLHLSSFIDTIQIKCDAVISKINYKSNDIWEYTEKSNTYGVYYLKIDNTHFK